MGIYGGKHTRISSKFGGMGDLSYEQPKCSCGWVGKKHYCWKLSDTDNPSLEFSNHVEKCKHKQYIKPVQRNVNTNAEANQFNKEETRKNHYSRLYRKKKPYN